MQGGVGLSMRDVNTIKSGGDDIKRSRGQIEVEGKWIPCFILDSARDATFKQIHDQNEIMHIFFTIQNDERRGP